MGKLRRKIIGKGFPIFAFKKCYFEWSNLFFFPFLVKSHLCSFSFARNIYEKRGAEQNDLVIPSTYWKVSLVITVHARLIVRNSKRRKTWWGGKEFFLGSLPCTVNMTQKYLCFIPHYPVLWGRSQDRLSQRLTGFPPGMKLKESSLLLFFLLLFHLAFLPSVRARWDSSSYCH